MKVLTGKKDDIFRVIINRLTRGMSSTKKGWDWRIEEAYYMLCHKDEEQSFIEDCLAKRKSNCKHKTHVGLRYFGCSWRMFCFSCGESRLCAIEPGFPTGNPSEKYLKSLAKKVEFV